MPPNVNTNSDIVEGGQAAQAIDTGQAIQASRGYAIAEGCEPSKPVAMTVQTAPGTFFVGGTRFTDSTSQGVALDAGGTEPRKDLIYYNATGTLAVAKGTPAPPDGPAESSYATDPFDFWQPAPPDHADIDGTPVAEVNINAGATDFNELKDLRARRTFSDLVSWRLSADEQLLLPLFDATADAPAVERSVIIISGVGTETEGIYRHDGTSYSKIGGATALSDITIDAARDWGGHGIANLGPIDSTQVSTPDLRVTQGNGLIGSTGRHSRYGLSSAPNEIARYTLNTNEKLIVNRMEVKMKGGGTNANFTADVYDESAAAVIASTSGRISAGATPLGESSAGATILLRYTNATEGAQDACISVQDAIVPV